MFSIFDQIKSILWSEVLESGKLVLTQCCETTNKSRFSYLNYILKSVRIKMIHAKIYLIESKRKWYLSQGWTFDQWFFDELSVSKCFTEVCWLDLVNINWLFMLDELIKHFTYNGQKCFKSIVIFFLFFLELSSLVT